MTIIQLVDIKFSTVDNFMYAWDYAWFVTLATYGVSFITNLMLLINK